MSKEKWFDRHPIIGHLILLVIVFSAMCFALWFSIDALIDLINLIKVQINV